MWTGTDDLLSVRDSRVFVPEGLNDRSQAIYCLECFQKGDPSRRDGVSRATRYIPAIVEERPVDPIIPCPTGRFPFLHGYQAINCLATIIQSLRDDPDERELVPTALSFERFGGPGRRGLRPRRRA